MAVTSHAEGDIGVCFQNTLDSSVSQSEAEKYNRIIDLDVDIGAEAVDYK